MNIPARRLACVAAVSGAASLVLLASPTLAGAAVTGDAEVTASGTITVEFTDITTHNNHCPRDIFARTCRVPEL